MILIERLEYLDLVELPTAIVKAKSNQRMTVGARADIARLASSDVDMEVPVVYSACHGRVSWMTFSFAMTCLIIRFIVTAFVMHCNGMY